MRNKLKERSIGEEEKGVYVFASAHFMSSRCDVDCAGQFFQDGIDHNEKNFRILFIPKRRVLSGIVGSHRWSVHTKHSPIPFTKQYGHSDH